MRFPEHNLVDFAIGDVRARNCVVDIRETLAARKTTAQVNSFITVYRFPESYRQHLEATGSVRGFEGTCYADYLPFDIDRAGNLQSALDAARGLAFTIQERFEVRSDQLRYFFSGAKGFHLLLPTQLFGDVEPSADLPAAFRALALSLASSAGQDIDRVIYDQNRLFRLPDTQHPSGLWKIELSWDELLNWSTDQIRFAARTVREFKSRPHDLEPIDALTELFAKAMDAAEGARSRDGILRVSGEGIAQDLAKTLEGAYVDGQKHNLILAFAGYAAKRNLPRESALGVVDNLLESKDDKENLYTAVEDTYDRIRQGIQVKGYLELAELVGAADLEQLRALLGDTKKPAQQAQPDDSPLFEPMLGDVLDRMAREKQQPIDATPTPWGLWNSACRGAGGGQGIARGWHIVLGARSGNGKSLVGANMAVAAIRAGERAAIVSLEMAQIEMQTRIMAIVAKQKINSLDHGKHFRVENWNTAKREMHRIREDSGGLLYINRRPINKLVDVGRAIQSLHEREGVRWFVVDYLQLAAIGGGRMAEMIDRITEVSFVVRGLAKELEVTTVGMSQLNRETSKSPQRPSKEGLMGGSPLENDAEQVVLLDHSRIERRVEGICSYAILDKNRHGEVVDIPTFLNSQTLELRERMADEESSRGVA